MLVFLETGVIRLLTAGQTAHFELCLNSGEIL
jgi:hypothetical protein